MVNFMETEGYSKEEVDRVRNNLGILGRGKKDLKNENDDNFEGDSPKENEANNVEAAAADVPMENNEENESLYTTAVETTMNIENEDSVMEETVQKDPDDDETVLEADGEDTSGNSEDILLDENVSLEEDEIYPDDVEYDTEADQEADDGYVGMENTAAAASDDLEYDASSVEEVGDEKPRVAIGPTVSMTTAMFDILAASFASNPLPSDAEYTALCSDTGLDMSQVKWFFLKVRHLVQENSVDTAHSEHLALYLGSLKLIYNNSEDDMLSL